MDEAAKKKPGLMLAIGLGKPSKKPAEDAAPEGEESMESGFDEAASAFIAAVKAGDDESAKAALKEAIAACNEEY